MRVLATESNPRIAHLVPLCSMAIHIAGSGQSYAAMREDYGNGAERLTEPNCHLGRDSTPTIEQATFGLASDAKHPSGLIGRQAQGLLTVMLE